MKAPHHRLLIAAGCIAVLGLAGWQAQHAAWAARALLAMAVLAAAGLWLHQRRSAAAMFRPAERVRVLSRTALQVRSAATLLQVDDDTYLVVHGEGFAEICPTPRPRALQGRRPRRSVHRAPSSARKRASR